jgi:nicotinamidase-related amidase
MPSDSTASDLVLDRGNALLLVVDVQDRLASAMPKDGMAQLQKNAAVLIRAARRLDLPVVATEQYPKGLGRTIPALRELLDAPPMEKLEFSCGASKPIARHIVGTGRKQVIVAGMESHVCVFQTVRDLLRGGFSVFLVQDAVVSRTEENREVGLRLCEKAGATVTSTEAVLFDLLGVAGTPEFKELAPLIK